MRAHLVLDFDSTIVTVESLDELAAMALEGRPDRGEVLARIKAITDAGMDGSLPIDRSLAQRLALLSFDRGLVDELGSLDEAVRAAANAAGIHDADRVALVHWPRARSLAAELAEVAAAASGPATEARLAEALGLPAGLASAAAWQSGVQAVAWPLPSMD